MFCEKCGAALNDDEECPNCDDVVLKSTDYHESPSSSNSEVVKAGKKNPVLVTIGVICAIILAIVIFSDNDNVDYIETVKILQPYKDYGISASYNTVINKYIQAPKWSERVKSKELAYVDVSGRINDYSGGTVDIAITFKLTPYEGKSDDMFWIELYSIEAGGSAFDEYEATSFIENMFEAYAEGWDSITDYYYYYY